MPCRHIIMLGCATVTVNDLQNSGLHYIWFFIEENGELHLRTSWYSSLLPSLAAALCTSACDCLIGYAGIFEYGNDRFLVAFLHLDEDGHAARLDLSPLPPRGSWWLRGTTLRTDSFNGRRTATERAAAAALAAAETAVRTSEVQQRAGGRVSEHAEGDVFPSAAAGLCRTGAEGSGRHGGAAEAHGEAPEAASLMLGGSPAAGPPFAASTSTAPAHARERAPTVQWQRHSAAPRRSMMEPSWVAPEQRRSAAGGLVMETVHDGSGARRRSHAGELSSSGQEAPQSTLWADEDDAPVWVEARQARLSVRNAQPRTRHSSAHAARRRTSAFAVGDKDTISGVGEAQQSDKRHM